MATTYELISSNVLTSSAASVTFSAIPSTWTDLCLKFSVRNNDTGSTYFRAYYNSDTSSTNYSQTYLAGDGATASSTRQSNNNFGITVIRSDASSDTANTFASGEIYIPNYAGSTYKPSSTFDAMETNSTTAYMNTIAGLWRDSSAITNIQCSMAWAGLQFVAGSSFYLYGIKNS